MKNTLELALEVTATSIDGQNVVDVLVPPSCVSHWCLSLQLLHDHLTDSCVFLLPNAKGKLEIQRATTSTHRTGNGTHLICLSANALDYLRCFFLKYFRDGFAEVDHVDIDDQERDGGYLTFSVLASSPPVSSEGARQRLGLDRRH